MVLAYLDTTTLANGSYVIRLQGTDINGVQQDSVLQYGYFPDHFFKEATDPRGESPVVTTYDPAGHIASVTDAAGNLTTYEYDVAAHTTEFIYNSDGHPTSILNPLDKTLGTVEYNQYDGPTTMTTAQGGDATVQYDPVTFMPLSASDDLGALGGYTWTDHGNRKSLTESGGGTISWMYDKFYRLTNEVCAGANTHFEYDDAGNRDAMTVNGVTTDYTYNSLDQLISAGSITYDYDGRGNLEQVTNGSQIMNYTWDAADRLAMANGPSSVVEFAYDADGRRIKQTVGSQTINYLWDEASAYGDVVLETDGNGTTLASYVLAGTELVSQTRNSSTSYYLQDRQGSTRALLNCRPE